MGVTQRLGTIPLAIFTDASNNIGIGGSPSGSFKFEVTGTGRFTGALNATTTFTLDGTKRVFLRSNQAAASGLLSGSALAAEGNFSIYSDSGVAAEVLGMYYWNGSTYRSALQFANVSSGNSNLILMKDGGNVGIGTSSPTGKLEVVGGVNTYQRITNTTHSISLDFVAGMTAAYVATPGNYPLVLGTNDTEKLRITASGFTKASNNGSYVVPTGTFHEFVSNVTNYQIATFTNSTSSPYGIEVVFNGADPNNATNWGLGFYTSSPSFVWIYRIFSNGTVASRSDARWKKNIETTRNGYLEDLCKLRVVKYNWYNHEEDAPKELGLIAQEVEEVFPNLVSYDKVTTKKQVEQEDGTFIEQEVEDGESRSIKTSVLPYMLLKALQEANAKIDELSAKVSALENKS